LRTPSTRRPCRDRGGHSIVGGGAEHRCTSGGRARTDLGKDGDVADRSAVTVFRQEGSAVRAGPLDFALEKWKRGAKGGLVVGRQDRRPARRARLQRASHRRVYGDLHGRPAGPSSTQLRFTPLRGLQRTAALIDGMLLTGPKPDRLRRNAPPAEGRRPGFPTATPTAQPTS